MVAYYVFKLVRGKTGRGVLVVVSGILVGYTGVHHGPALTTYLVEMSGTGNVPGSGPLRIVIAFLLAIVAGFVVYRMKSVSATGPLWRLLPGASLTRCLCSASLWRSVFCPGKLP